MAEGGTASGPVSFMRGADASAGTIKSGGKTRRAAKMVILNADHPDIEDFIDSKAGEEKKAWEHNIARNPDAKLAIEGRRYEVTLTATNEHGSMQRSVQLELSP